MFFRLNTSFWRKNGNIFETENDVQHPKSSASLAFWNYHTDIQFHDQIRSCFVVIQPITRNVSPEKLEGSGGQAEHLFRTIKQLTEGVSESLCFSLDFCTCWRIQSILDLLLQITPVYSRAFYQNFTFNKPVGALSFCWKRQETFLLISKWCFLPPGWFPLEIKSAQ